MSRSCMEAPRWMHRGTYDVYQNSAMVVVVTAVSEAVVAECVAAVIFPEEVYKTEEVGGAADKVRR